MCLKMNTKNIWLQRWIQYGFNRWEIKSLSKKLLKLFKGILYKRQIIKKEKAVVNNSKYTFSHTRSSFMSSYDSSIQYKSKMWPIVSRIGCKDV